MFCCLPLRSVIIIIFSNFFLVRLKHDNWRSCEGSWSSREIPGALDSATMSELRLRGLESSGNGVPCSENETSLYGEQFFTHRSPRTIGREEWQRAMERMQVVLGLQQDWRSGMFEWLDLLSSWSGKDNYFRGKIISTACSTVYLCAHFDFKRVGLFLRKSPTKTN